MLFQLNTLDDRPIYAQIGDQVKFAVAAGLLRPGELVPSVRELARQLVVNPNTVCAGLSRPPGRGGPRSRPGDGLAGGPGGSRGLPRRSPRVRPQAAPRCSRRGEAEQPGPRRDRVDPARRVGQGQWQGVVEDDDRRVRGEGGGR